MEQNLARFEGLRDALQAEIQTLTEQKATLLTDADMTRRQIEAQHQAQSAAWEATSENAQRIQQEQLAAITAKTTKADQQYHLWLTDCERERERLNKEIGAFREQLATLQDGLKRAKAEAAKMAGLPN